MNLEKEIKRRRTFAIISHPDAGKTTITEKLLLFGGAISQAGTVKAKRSKRYATSDWMELEKQRGISVTSSVMKFEYLGCEINIIDTPGHQDFSEDTYRTLTAVDSVLMIIDGANGVESQTKKLFEVCRLRKTPVMAFINKMDRESKNPLDLMSEIEDVLGIGTYPMTWPIGMGDSFKGVYHRQKKSVLLYERDQLRGKPSTKNSVQLDDSAVSSFLNSSEHELLEEDIYLLEEAGDKFSVEDYLAGEISPVFFGSAMYSFGIESVLDYLAQFAPCPLPRESKERTVDPLEEKFTGFIFKIQANMDPSHRDRVAFMRICSGMFERGSVGASETQLFALLSMQYCLLPSESRSATTNSKYWLSTPPSPSNRI